DLKTEDRWMIQTISDSIEEITANMDRFELALAAAKIYDLIWSNYCDWYIEFTKARLYGDNESDKETARFVLLDCLKKLLKMLHPFMPFITEEIWGHLPKGENEPSMIILADWPSVSSCDYSEDVKTVELSMDMIKAIRNIRSEVGVVPSKKIKAIVAADPGYEDAARKGEPYLLSLAGLESVAFVSDKSSLPSDVKSAALPGVELYVPMDELVDYREELAKLKKDREQLEKNVASQNAKLANENFVSRAPENVVQAERDKLANYEDMLSKTVARIAEVEKKI
ncbi:MAG: class I tRNA ligase family protein, partial [Firmicutes bacterium]|nr:class I tRNA ligase family protein [Bacillota bacterium]